MRYPVTATGDKKFFDQFWYVAQGFGNPTSYGFHEGADINLKTGGDTDLGQELKAIASGKIVYYHYSSHPNNNFGRHLVLRIEGAWGVRWCHYAHCLDQGFLGSVTDITEGQIIARLGKSGTPYAHLHLSIFKVDPASVGGIDTIANNSDKLYAVWEDPIAFIDRWMQPVVTPPVTDQSLYDFGSPWGVMELQRAKSILREQETKLVSLNTKLESIKQVVNS